MSTGNITITSMQNNSPVKDHIAVLSKDIPLAKMCQKLSYLYRRCELRNQKDAEQVCEDERNAMNICLNILEEEHRKLYVVEVLNDV